MNRKPTLRTRDYTFDLPPEQIAGHPLSERSGSRLLTVSIPDGTIAHRSFDELDRLLSANATLVVNDTRVVKARISLAKHTGGVIEFLLLEPVDPSHDPAVALQAIGATTWRCMVGGLKKLRSSGEAFGSFPRVDRPGTIEIRATLMEEEHREKGGAIVRFTWEPDELSFADILSTVGRLPLPPYLNRAATESDAVDYQTVYAVNDGAVAAPTAGLHFTPDLIDRLERKGIERIPVTLHVGAGTFAPVTAEDIAGHRMHEERIVLTRETLTRLRAAARRREKEGCPIVAVGTTSMRTLESLYWIGERLLATGMSPLDEAMFVVDQWYGLDRSDRSDLPLMSDALDRIDDHFAQSGEERLFLSTSLLIIPGYRFATCDGLITNFHQPGSTLILLVAAFLGGDLWRKVYDEALREGYRFLSYGDSSLLYRENVIDRESDPERHDG